MPPEVIKGGNSGGKWWYPIIPSSKSGDPEFVKAKNAKIKLLATAVKIAAINITVDIKVEEMAPKDAIKAFETYLPSALWADNQEKLMGLHSLKHHIEELVEKYITEDIPLSNLKMEFLNSCEAYFERYFEESFERVVIQIKGTR